MTSATTTQNSAAQCAVDDKRVLRALSDSAFTCAALALPGRTWSVTGLLSKGNKLIVYGELADSNSDADGAPGRQELVAKVYGSDRGGPAHDALIELWSAGFREPSPYQVPRPYAYVSELRTLFQARVRGATWADSLAQPGPALEAASNLAAEWLLALQAVAPRGMARSVDEHIAGVNRHLADLAATFPERLPDLDGLRRKLTARLAEDRSPAVSAHGDYHPFNISVSRGRATVIDFDTYRPCVPAFDVGYALGQLLIVSFVTTGSSLAGARAGRTFWSRYARSGIAEWRNVATQVARTLVQSLHFELCTFHTGRFELIPLWLGGIEAWLSASGPEDVFAAPLGVAERTAP